MTRISYRLAVSCLIIFSLQRLGYDQKTQKLDGLHTSVKLLPFPVPQSRSSDVGHNEGWIQILTPRPVVAPPATALLGEQIMDDGI